MASYTVPAGTRRIHAGKPRWPAWRTAIPAGHWGTLADVGTCAAIDPDQSPEYNGNWPASSPWTAGVGPQDRIMSWAEMAYLFGREELWLHGGGHADYGGNEIYSLDLRRDVPAWTMRRPPSGAKNWSEIPLNDGNDASNEYQDGRPRSVHTYRQLVVAKNGTEFWRSVGGSRYFDGNGDDSSYRWVNEIEDWERHGADRPFGRAFGASDYDPVRNVIWQVGNSGFGGLYEFSLDTFTYVERNGFSYAGTLYPYLHYNPDLDEVITHIPGEGWQHTPLSPTIEPPKAIVESGGPGTNLSLAGITYDTIRSRYVVWGPRADRTELEIFTVPLGDIGTWTLEPATGGVTPSEAYSTGSGPTTYGRLRYSAFFDGCFLYNHVTEPVYFRAFS